MNTQYYNCPTCNKAVPIQRGMADIVHICDPNRIVGSIVINEELTEEDVRRIVRDELVKR